MTAGTLTRLGQGHALKLGLVVHTEPGVSFTVLWVNREGVTLTVHAWIALSMLKEAA